MARHLGDQSGPGDRHRREIAEPGERFCQVPAAPGQSPGDELQPPPGRLRYPRSPGRRPHAGARGHAPGRLGKSPPHGPRSGGTGENTEEFGPRPAGDRFHRSPARSVQPTSSADRPLRASTSVAAGQDIRPVERAEHGRGGRHRHVLLSQGRRRGALPRLAGRGRAAYLPHRRRARRRP